VKIWNPVTSVELCAPPGSIDPRGHHKIGPFRKRCAGEAPLTPSADYLNRSNAAPHILKVLMDQHSTRGKMVGGTGTDYVFIGSLQSVLASLDEARNSFLAASEGDSALSNKQKSIVTKLKTAAKPALAQKGRKTLSEMELIDAIAREIRDVAPLVREFHAEERLQKAGAPLDR